MQIPDTPDASFAPSLVAYAARQLGVSIAEQHFRLFWFTPLTEIY